MVGELEGVNELARVICGEKVFLLGEKPEYVYSVGDYSLAGGVGDGVRREAVGWRVFHVSHRGIINLIEIDSWLIDVFGWLVSWVG